MRNGKKQSRCRSTIHPTPEINRSFFRSITDTTLCFGNRKLYNRTNCTDKEETDMSNLVAIVFNDETTAFDMRASLLRMQKQYLIDLEDSVVVTKNQKGTIKLDQAVNLTAAGAVGGGFWGMLIGFLFLNPF